MSHSDTETKNLSYCRPDRAGSRHRSSWPPAILALLLLAVPSAYSQPQPDPTYREIAPILSERCVICHSGETPAAGLRLDSYDAILRGSSRGAVVKSGDISGSELLRRIKGISQPRMPLTGPPFLSESQVAVFERWVATGLAKGNVDPADLAPTVMKLRPAPGEMVTYLHVAPIFAQRCAKCHTDNGMMGPAPEGFRLTSYASTLAADDRVRVVPGNSKASELVRRIRSQARPRMPFDGPPYLDEDEIQLIADWIDQGARDTEGKVAAIPAGARVRLHGTLGVGGQLDGLDLVISARTRIDKRPAPGDYVQVRGWLDKTGRVNVERLRRR